MSAYPRPRNDELPSTVECAWLPLLLPDRDELDLLRRAGATEFGLREVRAFWVIFSRDGFFELARHPGDGERAFIVPVRSVWEETVDLAAWRPHAPQSLALMTGAAAMLGEGVLENPATFASGRAVVVHRSVLSWLAADRHGVVLVDPARAGLRLAEAPAIRGEDVAHAHELGRLLQPHVSAARILAPLAGSRAA